MGRRKLNKEKETIQFTVSPEEKQAFDMYCNSNNVTMSEILRKEIAPYVAKGIKLLEALKKEG